MLKTVIIDEVVMKLLSHMVYSDIHCDEAIVSHGI